MTHSFTLSFNSLSTYGPVKNKLGSGSYGYVCRTEKNFALKTYSSSSYDSIREVSILCYLSHEFGNKVSEFVIPITDLALGKFDMYLIMPLMEGNLYDLRHLSIQEKKNISDQILDSISYLHSKYIVHLDIKLQNFLYTKNASGDYLIKICDFGISNTSFSSLKKSKCVYAFSYRAPEIFLGDKYDERVESWAIGCALAELFLGRNLLRGIGEFEIYKKLFEVFGTPSPEEYPRLRKLKHWTDEFEYVGPSVSVFQRFSKEFGEDVGELLNSLLQMNPSKRIFPCQAKRFFSTNSFTREPLVLLQISRSTSKYYTKQRKRYYIKEWMRAVSMVHNMSKRALIHAYVLFEKYVYEMGEKFSWNSNRVPSDPSDPSDPWNSALSIPSVPCNDVQQIATTCLYVSSALHDNVPIKMSDAETFSADTFIGIEFHFYFKKILKMMNYILLFPTAIDVINSKKNMYSKFILRSAKRLYISMHSTDLIYEARQEVLAEVSLYMSCKKSNDISEPVSNEVFEISQKLLKAILLNDGL